MPDAERIALDMIASIEFELAQLRAILAQRHPSDTGHVAPPIPILTHDGSAGVPLDCDDPPSKPIDANS